MIKINAPKNDVVFDVNINEDNIEINAFYNGKLPAGVNVPDKVGEYFKVNIYSDYRGKETVKARQIAMYLLYKHKGLTLDAIKKIFKKKQHGTVMRAIENIESFINTYPEYKADVEYLKAII